MSRRPLACRHGVPLINKTAFNYYGSKSKIARYYPLAKHDMIVEPFAGSAAYSQLYWNRDVVLYEIDLKIVAIWEFLISATKDDILNLPNVNEDTDVDELDIPDGAKYMIGLIINQGSAQPKRSASSRAIARGWWNNDKRLIAGVVNHFNHWKIFNADYFESSDIGKATWFIDPPYQIGGEYYKYHDIDYNELKGFIYTRKGQVIVCENDSATWMKFSPLVSISGMTHRSTMESIYYREEQ